MNWRRWLLASQWLLLAALVALAVVPAARSYEARTRAIDWVAIDELPPQARETLARVRRGGPFRYVKDGTTFFNREGLLPRRQRGYYTEYTVPTPGARDRGARRIVAGGDPRFSGEYYYTGDHYRSFRRIRE
ncbi:MAG: ribonuclease [Burkholderiaceae bacterium]|nr:ribonuclease [Burkholderiaceae bacterium]